METVEGGGSLAAARVVVTNIDKGSQAETLGVMPKWSIKSVNGVEVTGFSSAEKMLKEGAAKLSDAERGTRFGELPDEVVLTFAWPPARARELGG
eukprot:CAMPEP_0203924742 /NCGR_PEP_ID=MMETSP0359-20131031/64473_1 /ASSEMBLY_ACC=CAM_ASM_000338 /TAXON_ID=268821 /ORGANISM="Scrippsiella Hangoei, Strain SHTV-5" /LENGTH=94 /DNA_ID=CAMNT_0050853033 /DNA_START=120 /DNA_END=401 /DNA_ORIENTATION=-